MKITELKVNDEFERVVSCEDEETGLKAIIAVHSTTLGPAAGGCRMFNYDNFDDAVTDVLRLSRGMTYKNAAAGLKLGGGKSVIVGDPKTQKTPELMKAFGRFVDSLEGMYYTAEDVGISVSDIELVSEVTPYAVGLDKGEFAAGDPSPFTARGVYLSMKEAAARKLGNADLKGVKVAIQGLGHVGMYLAEFLHKEGAVLLVSDINESALNEAKERFDAEIIDVDKIHLTDAEIFAPCAMGAALTREVIEALQAKVVCGAANNQLADEECGALLMARGILYGPDYVVNSGGIINVATEIFKITDPKWVEEKMLGLAEFTGMILDQANENGQPPHEIADQKVRSLLEA